MSSDGSPDIPSPLRDRLREEAAEDRAALEAVWQRLGALDRLHDTSPDRQAEWEALQERRPAIDPETEAAPRAPSPNGRPPAADRTADRPRARRRPSSPKRTGRRRWAWALAAALILALAGGWLWRQPVTVTAPTGQQRTAALPDGSTVELNSGTTLSYRRGFQTWPFVDAERRVVRLDGEAFFRVDAASRPFVVETATARVTVEGTRFNVRARPRADSTTEVTLAAGRVQVSARRAPDRAVVLDRQGLRTRVRAADAAPSPPEPAQTDYVLAWRQDGFAVSERPLAQVLAELERRYGTTLRLHDSVRRTTAPVSLYYPTPTGLTVILRDLCTALDLNYRPTNRGYEVFAAPDRR
jgi:ferric-dicitrate binding protein FerR (iron transport regulator)